MAMQMVMTISGKVMQRLPFFSSGTSSQANKADAEAEADADADAEASASPLDTTTVQDTLQSFGRDQLAAHKSTSTIRLGQVSTLRQVVAWLMPSVVVHCQAIQPAKTDNQACTKQAKLSVGSACNAVWANKSFDLVINCCPQEMSLLASKQLDSGLLRADDDHIIELAIEDTNNVVLNVDAMLVILKRAKQVWQAGGSILVNCWMGASRSVAIACFLICCLDTNNEDVEARFNKAYNQCKSFRSVANMSVRLKHEVCRVIQHCNL